MTSMCWHFSCSPSLGSLPSLPWQSESLTSRLLLQQAVCRGQNVPPSLTGILTWQSVDCCTDRPPSRPGTLNSRFCGWTCICQAPSCRKRYCRRQPTRNCLPGPATQFFALSVKFSLQSRSRPRPWPLSTAEMVTRLHATLVLIYLRHPCQAADLARLTPPRHCWTADGLTIHHTTSGPGHSSRVLSAATAISGQAPTIHD